MVDKQKLNNTCREVYSYPLLGLEKRQKLVIVKTAKIAHPLRARMDSYRHHVIGTQERLIVKIETSDLPKIFMKVSRSRYLEGILQTVIFCKW